MKIIKIKTKEELKRGTVLCSKKYGTHYAIRNVHRDGTFTIVGWLNEKYVGRYAFEYIERFFNIVEIE